MKSIPRIIHLGISAGIILCPAFGQTKVAKSPVRPVAIKPSPFKYAEPDPIYGLLVTPSVEIQIPRSGEHIKLGKVEARFAPKIYVFDNWMNSLLESTGLTKLDVARAMLYSDETTDQKNLRAKVQAKAYGSIKKHQLFVWRAQLVGNEFRAPLPPNLDGVVFTAYRDGAHFYVCEAVLSPGHVSPLVWAKGTANTILQAQRGAPWGFALEPCYIGYTSPSLELMRFEPPLLDDPLLSEKNDSALLLNTAKDNVVAANWFIEYRQKRLAANGFTIEQFKTELYRADFGYHMRRSSLTWAQTNQIIRTNPGLIDRVRDQEKVSLEEFMRTTYPRELFEHQLK